LLLGVILGVMSKHGHDKVTIVASPAIASLGAWLEQLLAESTGKVDKGIIPVDGEAIGKPTVYGDDRLHIYIRLRSKPDPAQDKAFDDLQGAGQQLVRINIEEPGDLGQEFYRWEFATAVAGSIIGINAFNQPDVEASKIATRNLMAEYEKSGKLQTETPFFEADGLRFFADSANTAELKKAAKQNESVVAYLAAHFARIKKGDYLAILAFIERNQKHQSVLNQLRQSVRDAKNIATCVGFGPRYLHSTGQAYKGGPNSGIFLQITSDEPVDVSIPEQKYTFATVTAAQARGDLEVLAQRKRRLLRVHLVGDSEAGLNNLYSACKQALK